MRIKALSVRQPWAELVLRGEKSLLLRTWTTSYRGPLAIHASRMIKHEACARWGMDPVGLSTGAVLGVVQLAEVFKLDEEAYAENERSHLREHSFRDPLYAWVVNEPVRLRAPWPAAGRQRLFDLDVPDVLLPGESNKGPEGTGSHQEATPFELRVLPGKETASGSLYGLALYQRRVNGEVGGLSIYDPQPSRDMVRVAELHGERLRTLAEAVLSALREAGYRATDLSPSRRESFRLPEEVGVRLGLLFLAAKPVSKISRLEAIMRGLLAMPAEEAYYWYSKCAYGPQASRARRALRVMLAEE
jgi:hypothetical protein